ncbi:MAG: SH3 domain-containing protein [Ferruginibacter sp.]
MSLQDKYQSLIDTAKQSGVSGLQVREQDNVLYIDGDAPSASVKDQLWNIYNQIDPDYKSGDVVLNVNATTATGSSATVATNSGNLNIRKGPGTDQEIIGKAAHGESVTILSEANDQWNLIKTANGEQGYVYKQYLSAQ